ncbi:helicase associated domain-containing protein [Botryobacter ruber]|uniref:helicase associated domain-containing protein n=1 Tax=Botryobacter ruber TaxID=2171629 RepID=UPI000E0AAA1C|nr:helicase associated domain-containing protein [Botryobacter ruber]
MEHQGEGLFNREFLEKWYQNYGRLKVHVQKNPLSTGAVDEELAQWVSIQRRIRYMLPAELKERLAELNSVFQYTANSWDTMYKQLVLFVRETGHCVLPDDKEYEQLKDWLIRQILNKWLLTDVQLQQLNELEVDWDMPVSREHRWNQMFWRLKDFYRTFGHCRVPLQWSMDKQLALWVVVQRRMHKQGKLSEDRERRLNELQFTWRIQDVYEAQWEEFFQQLLSFSRRHGHCRVPCRHEKLVSWIERQRVSWKKGQLPQDRLKRLEEIGFIWSSEDMKRRSWEVRYKQLKEYKRLVGHSFVSTNYRENRSLGIWVSTQRRLEAKGKLPAAKRKKLDQLGFVWSKNTECKLQSVYDKHWNDSFEKLKAYRQQHGTCQVSLKLDPELQRWTSWQRKLFYKGKLLQARIDRLNEIRFPWSVQEGYWLKMYEALVDFKTRSGHTRVPFQWAPNPHLSRWVYRLRRQKQELSTQKVELLNKIGFDWSLNRRIIVPWQTMFYRLLEFKQEHGHTRVPVKWSKDPKLGKWVSRMRQERENLDPERALLLESISFDWGNRFTSKKNIGINFTTQV